MGFVMEEGGIRSDQEPKDSDCGEKGMHGVLQATVQAPGWTVSLLRNFHPPSCRIDLLLGPECRFSVH